MDRLSYVDTAYIRCDCPWRGTFPCFSYKNEEIGVEVVKEVQRKCSLIKIPRGFSLEKALISLYGPSSTLKTLDYFDHYLTLREIFDSRKV
ncbi:MAG: hypothetical protein HQK49_22955 [Oligoflexia bacterium]|nr:hypothetical protein [Oligoflexia bacterium]